LLAAQLTDKRRVARCAGAAIAMLIRSAARHQIIAATATAFAVGWKRS
jgi:hypothetical protein